MDEASGKPHPVNAAIGREHEGARSEALPSVRFSAGAAPSGRDGKRLFSLSEPEAKPAAAPLRHGPFLLIGSDPAIGQDIALQLTDLGYEVTVAEGKSKVMTSLIVNRKPDGVNSGAMIEALCGEGFYTPVLFVVAATSVDQYFDGTQAGGGDISQPFAMLERAARVEALLRSQRILQAGPLRLDLIERRAWRETRELCLLPREFKLLEYLMRHPNQIVTRAILLEDVWNYRIVPRTNLVDVHLGKVRRKVNGPGEPPLIECIRGVGFLLRAAE